MYIIFFISLFILFYTFVGYPFILRFVKTEKSITPLRDEFLPNITVVLCIHNSADSLAARIKNIYDSDYPSEKIQLLIVSDGSTDQPENVIPALNNPAVKLLHYDENKGKSFALSYAFEHISTPITAFTDIRQTFDSMALRYLASKLSNKSIGAVSGNLKITSHKSTEEQGLYWKYEKAIRIKESAFHSLLGVTGAIYMAKTELLPTLPKNSLLDDMYIPLSIVKQGYQVKFCEQAIAYDIVSGSVQEEFTRKVRTLAGNYQLMKQLPWLLSIKHNPLFFQFISHKIARLAMPFALITLFVSSFFLPSPEKYIIIFAQTFFYCYTVMGYLTETSKLNLPLAGICVSFCSLNLAALVATWKYTTEKDITTLWKKH